MNKFKFPGVYDLEYAFLRNSKKSLKYRLWRRTHEVLGAIEQFAIKPAGNILDLGTAEGRMLDVVSRKHPLSRCIGIEYNIELVEYGKKQFPHLFLVQGDIDNLSFKSESFDVVIATAVIEHVPHPDNVIQEVKRVLNRSGIIIITSPDPFWEHLAKIVGHLKDVRHYEVMNIKRLYRLINRNGFSVVKVQKFMLSPIGLPLEFPIEKAIRMARLNFLLANQLVVGKKK